MRGTHTVRSPLSRAAALAAAITVFASFGWSSPASAHLTTNHRKARRHVVERAKNQIGVPYNYGAESPSSGFDCSGLMYWAFKNHGDTLPRSSSDQWRLRKVKGYKRVWKRRNLVKGDLMFFRTSGSGVGHVAMYIGHRKMIHSGSSGGRVRVDSINESYYRARWVGAVRVPALRK